jgi:DNA-binding winged helix-turn-helix (wHTH) protein
MPARLRYRFERFVVSTARRQLLEAGAPVPLIPRYFDLLVLLIERRHEAVHRREIFDSVWSDVVVSDGALSQAVRTLRRALADDPREPRFLRTVSRHGYQFVWPGVASEPDDGPLPDAAPGAPHAAESADPFQAALSRLLADDTSDDDRLDAGEALHALGTAEALARLAARPGHERGRAFLRDTRFDVPGAGDVPIAGQAGALRAFRELFRLRMQRALRLVATRLGAAVAGGALAGLFAGFVGGHVLRLSPGADLPPRVPVVLALLGALIGSVGAAGVGAGLACAEALVRSWRGSALVALGALGGGGLGALASLLGVWTIEGLFGVQLAGVGGGLEGVVIGAAAGLGYALGAPRPREGGMASPRGAQRLRAVLTGGLLCALASVALTLAGGHLGSLSVDSVARAFPGSRVSLLPLARLFGEPSFGPLTGAVTSAYEGLLFGCGLVLGLTRRPR